VPHEPRLTLKTDQVVVFDSFLPQPAVAELLRFADQAPYKSVHHDGWHKVWRVHDGLPLRGPTTRYSGPDLTAVDDAPSSASRPVDAFARGIRDVLGEVSSLVGEIPADWDAISVTPWLYARGTGLSLHRDGAPYAGSYTYFLHPHWDLHWGGWLFVLASAEDQAHVRRAFLDNRAEAELISATGYGTCILPMPNRAVFISPRARHMISRVDDNAGNSVRISLAGFMQRREQG
jgi:hypothetical protein